jgi:multifunctional 2-oxoglutarate metabolism enzyme
VAAEVAIVRVEQIYPWPVQQITATFERYSEATEVVWLQEEPENMGGWSFVHARLHACLPDRLKLRHVSRGESASPAIGSAALHALEQADLLRRSIG